jgi:hypothetical protein
MFVYKPGSNVNDRFRPLSSGRRGLRVSRAEQQRVDEIAALQRAGDRRVAEATAKEEQLVKEAREYIAHKKAAKARGRKPRLARKEVLERVRTIERVGNLGRHKPRKKKK